MKKRLVVFMILLDEIGILIFLFFLEVDCFVFFSDCYSIVW